ncbi:hypothetical protein K439DRAFT_1620021 [Ramaria rubella]|nr:hypothetical protein K439DRAFT_1620021 [Ramaria rubella]
MTETQAAYFDIAYNYCELSGITLLVYDYIVTLPREISHLWGWPWGGYDPRDFSRNQSWLHYFRPKIDKSTLLYVLTRYTLLFAWILSPILSFHPDIDRTMDIVSQITVAFILLLRTYALWGENLLVLIMLGFVGSGIPGIGIWSIVLTNCGYTFDASQESQLKLVGKQCIEVYRFVESPCFSRYLPLFSILVLPSLPCIAILGYEQERWLEGVSAAHFKKWTYTLRVIIFITVTSKLKSICRYVLGNSLLSVTLQVELISPYRPLRLSVNVISHFMLDLKEMAHDATWQTATMSFVFFHDAELTTTAMIGGSVDQSEVTVT